MSTLKNTLVVVLAAGVIALGACAPRAKVFAPAPDGAGIQSESGSGTATATMLNTDSGDANSGGTYPYGSVAPVTGTTPPGQSTAAQSTNGIVVQSPDGTIWSGPATNKEQYRTDVESCYSYATAQVAHDQRIEEDRFAGLSETTPNSDFSSLRGRMRDFNDENRRKSLFGSCMKSKGYVSK